MPLLFLKMVTNSKNDSETLKKVSVSLYIVKSIDIATIHCTSINIHAVWIFFGFWPIIWKRNWKKKLSISLSSSLRRIHWYLTHFNLINIHASLFFWKKFCFWLKIRKRIQNLKKAFHCTLRRIHWYITHCNLINIHASLFYWIFFGFWEKYRKQIWNKLFVSL